MTGMSFMVIANVLFLGFIALAFFECGRKGKIILGVTVVLLFVFPWIYPRAVPMAFIFSLRAITGVGSFMFVKYRGFM